MMYKRIARFVIIKELLIKLLLVMMFVGFFKMSMITFSFVRAEIARMNVFI